MGIPYARSHVELQDGDRAAINRTQTFIVLKKLGVAFTVQNKSGGEFAIMGHAVDGRRRG